MCRIAAYAGQVPVPLSHLLFDQPRSLQELAYAPREMMRGNVNTDGTGIVWFDDTPDPTGNHVTAPLRYRTQLPPWGDQTLVELAPRLRSRIILASVRSTTAGIPQGQAFVHPFVAGNLAGTHNGWISNFRHTVARRLMAELSDESFALVDGMSDSNVLFLLAADAYGDGAGLIEAARHATTTAAKIIDAAGQTATLTLALADHTGVAVVNDSVGMPGNSLYARREDDRTLVASEPLDETDTWTPLTKGDAVSITPTTCDISRGGS